MQECQPDEQALALLAQVDFYLATILLALPSDHEPALLTTGDQRHHAVLVGLQALGEFADFCVVASLIPLDMQEQQILKRSDTVGSGGAFRKSLEAPHLISKFGQLLEGSLRYRDVNRLGHRVFAELERLDYTERRCR